MTPAYAIGLNGTIRDGWPTGCPGRDRVARYGWGAVKTSTQAAFRDAPFQLRGASFTMMVLKVGDPRNPNFFPVLSGKIAQAPNFFKNAPVVLDLDDLPAGMPFDFGQFCGLLRNLGMVAVGLQGGTAEQQKDALAAGLALLPPPRDSKAFDPLAGTGRAPAQGIGAGGGPVEAQPRPAAQPAPAPPPAPAARGTLMITEPVRSGRQIYAEGGDLVVVGPVSPGAELVADGSIHVYGALRGRALAGVGGDKASRIFCQSLEAELVSIAGLYRIADDMDRKVLRKQVQIFLDDGFLHIDPVAA